MTKISLFLVLSAIFAVGKEKPNILVIVADDLGYGDLGFTGHPKIKTPHLDQLAKDGATFTNFYAPAQVCSPSRAATLTGRMPHRHGLYSFIGGSSGSLSHLPKFEVTIPQLLRKNGYQTAIIGKWHCSLIDVQMKRAQEGKTTSRIWITTDSTTDFAPTTTPKSATNPAGLVTANTKAPSKTSPPTSSAPKPSTGLPKSETPTNPSASSSTSTNPIGISTLPPKSPGNISAPPPKKKRSHLLRRRHQHRQSGG